MKTRFVLATVLIYAALAVSAIAQDRGEDQPLPEGLDELYLKKRESIDKAIKESKNEWTDLTLNPKAAANAGRI
ncbi:MAG TPA: hypothetical protein VMZ26_11465 [Pyrinomonadaceae bacterium]|nr:hypothetical protein [Pyrinomonadaceae bacterium]